MDKKLNRQQSKINEVPVGIYAYDMALIEDLRTRFNLKKDGTPKTNNNVYITNAENVFEIIGDVSNDEIKFPLISLVRTGWSISDEKPEMMTKAGALKDVKIGDKDGKLKQIRLQAIPISINYQIDVWTRTRIDNDAVTRELVWYYTLNPQLLVEIPHGLNMTHPFNIFFESEIEDNSDIVEHINRGQYFRQTLGLYINDAYLWRSSVKNVTTVESVGFEIYTGEIPEESKGQFDEFISIPINNTYLKGEESNDRSKE